MHIFTNPVTYRLIYTYVGTVGVSFLLISSYAAVTSLLVNRIDFIVPFISIVNLVLSVILRFLCMFL